MKEAMDASQSALDEALEWAKYGAVTCLSLVGGGVGWEVGGSYRKLSRSLSPVRYA